MALLVAIERTDREWDVVVLARLAMAHLQDRAAMRDVLDRAVPPFGKFRAYDGISADEAVRLANALRGMSRARRMAYFEAAVPRLKQTMTGN